MTGKTRRDCSSLAAQFLTLFLRLPWVEIAVDGWKTIKSAYRGFASEGMYDVLDYESTLELHGQEGKKATFHKRQKVRYLQNYIIAFEDQAWGDGEILINYRCSPGIPVDQYRLDYKTFVLISRREIKNRGDIDEFNIRWDIRNGFLRKSEQWATEVRRRIKHLKVSVIFPKNRPPTSWSILEKNRQRAFNLSKETRQQLPDGRWRITWGMKNPRLFETYILKWEW